MVPGSSPGGPKVGLGEDRQDLPGHPWAKAQGADLLNAHKVSSSKVEIYKAAIFFILVAIYIFVAETISKKFN